MFARVEYLSLHRIGGLAVLVLSFLGGQPCIGQNIVSNASFETGASSPTPWLRAGPGAWENFGHTGTHCVSVLGQSGSIYSWYAPLTIQTGKPYWIGFWCAATNSLGGYCFGGISTVSHDFARPSEQWTEYAYAAWLPDAGTPQFTMSSWNGSGPVYFDDAEVLPLNAVHTQFGNYQLGLGESLNGGLYQFDAPYDSFGANFSRPIYQGNAIFNTANWYFNAGSYVTYRHELGGEAFTNAQVTCGIVNYNNIIDTTVIVEASTDGVGWQPVGTMMQTTSATFPIPASLQPASVLYVRLRSTNPAQFSLASYSFSANVPDQATTATGDTLFLGKLLPGDDVRIVGISNTLTGRLMTLSIPNLAFSSKQFSWTAQTTCGTVTRQRSVTVTVPARATNLVSLLLPMAGFGNNTAVLTVGDVSAGTNIFQQIYRFNVDILTDDSFGELLPSPSNCPIWSCSGDFKVGLNRGLPLTTNTAVQVSSARNEYEAFQFVLRPGTTLSNVWASIGDFVSVTNSGIGFSATNVSVDRVEYVPVPVADPENPSSGTGDYPDPLMPLTVPFDAPGGTNSPLWFTIHVPKNIPSGDYVASVAVQFDGGSFTVPVRLHVFGFALTDVSHTRTAYGMVPLEVWHGIPYGYSPQAVQIWELYLQNMARHRASPYCPQYYSPIQWYYDAPSDSFTYDFTAFDAIMERCVEEYDFSSFRDFSIYSVLPQLGDINIYNDQNDGITPEYQRLYTKFIQPVVQHFRERGWLDFVYTQWIDEPTADQTELVRQGMDMIQAAAPDYRRAADVYVGPQPALFGTVDNWGVHFNEATYYDQIQPRQAVGEQVWYYMHMAPKEPWPNNLIDLPGLCPRIRQWYAERTGFDGEVYWGVDWYLGMTNPWTQTMTRGGVGTVADPYFDFGYGDGNLIYPPVKEKPTNNVIISGPVNSTRFESARDGYEDREYFWLLKRVLALATPHLGTNNSAVIEGNAALANVSSLLSWPPIYPYEPSRLEAVRLRVAAAIESLETGAPWVARDPFSKVVTNGAAQTLRVEAAGWPVPSIQWQHAGTNLPGATSAKLMLTNITISMAGDYRVLLTNSVGTAASAAGKLVVLDVSLPPQIIAQPAGLTRTNLGRAVLGVGASSLTPMTYQWWHDSVPIVGATNITLVLSNLTQMFSGGYSVIVSNAAGATASTAASLNVLPPDPPSILSPPAGATIMIGQSASFSVSADGTPPLSYQWQLNGTNLPSGGTDSSLSLANVQLSQAGGYRVIVTNVAGAVTSTVASLVVQAVPPTLTSPPTNQLIVPGGSVSFTAVATGTAPLNFRWFFNTTNLTGAVSNVLSLNNIQSAQLGNYVVVVTNAGGAVTSAPASLQFYTMPNYTNEPPGISGSRSNANLVLTLAPDNRNRTVFVSTNLLTWTFFYSATPSNYPVMVPTATTNGPRRFFRLQVTP